MNFLTGYGRRRVALLMALAALPEMPVAQTFTVTGAMPVTIEIVAECTVRATDLYFGTYLPTSLTPTRGQTTIQVNCGVDQTAELFLDAGTGSVNNTRRRQLTEGRGLGRLDYDLYQDPGRTLHWGDKSGRDTVEIVTTGATQAVTVYGEIPAGQRASDGTYSDTITVTVLF